MADDGRELTPPSGEVGLLALGEAAERLASPYACDEFATASGRPSLGVELSGEPPGDEACTALATALARLACTTIAFVPEPEAPAARALALAFDVQVETRGDLDRAHAAVERTPLAATALAQLLRGQEGRDVESGLVAESLTYSTLQSGPEFAAWLATQPTLRPEIPEQPPVRVERAGERLDVVLDHPGKRNAYSAAMRDQLCEALQLAVQDDAIHEVVLRGTGPAFCSGGDLDEFGLLADPATAHAIRTARSAARWLAALGPRVRAELHGACVGAGIELPAFAGRVQAHEDAFFQLPELGMGLVPGAGGTVGLPRRIGRQRTAWLALTGHRLDLDTARSWGLVDDVL